MADLKPVSPGQTLSISASDYNAMLDAARAHRARKTLIADESAAKMQAGIILVRNDTATDRDFQDVLSIDVPLILPAESLNQWRSRVAMSCVEPGAGHGRFVVLQEPIAVGKIGRAMITGVTPVMLDVTAETDGFAEVTYGVATSLKTGTSGSARILWKETGTGVVRGVVMLTGQARPSALHLDVAQAAHGLTAADIGKAFVCSAGGWTLFTDGDVSYAPVRPLWGILDDITSPDTFRLVIGGVGLTTSTTLEVGSYYTFQNGLPVEITGGYPPIEAAGAGIAVVAVSSDSVMVTNDGRFQGLRSIDGTYAVVSHASIGAGHYIVWAGVPSGESPLALADQANPWKWTNVGIALFEVDAAGTWLVLTQGNHTWYDYDNGDSRPGWMTTPPYNVGQRICLSETNPGQYATAEPAFKVYAGISLADYHPADPPSPEATTFVAKAVGVGLPYPIPPSGGGTGTDVSLLNEHSVLFMDTYGSPSSRKVAGLLSATADYAVIAQKNNEAPVHLSLDLTAVGSFVASGGALYAAAGGKKFKATAPTTPNQFLKFDGTEWAPFFLLNTTCAVPAWDGSSYIQVAAAANGTMMQRRADALEFSADPTLTRSGVDFKLCTVNTITTSTSAPTAAGVKGQMHFIY